MTDLVHGWPGSARAGAVVALVAAVGAVLLASWVNEAEEARENERIYEQCLSRAQDIVDVRACTAEFYARWDGRVGDPRRTQVALEAERLVELRDPGADVPRPTAPTVALPPQAPAATTPVAEPAALAPGAPPVVGTDAALDAADAEGDDDATEPAGGRTAEPTPSSSPRATTTTTKQAKPAKEVTQPVKGSSSSTHQAQPDPAPSGSPDRGRSGENGPSAPDEGADPQAERTPPPTAKDTSARS